MDFHMPHMPHMPHIPHPHMEKRREAFLKARQEASDFNSKLAVRITNMVGTMWCAYAFACLALISLPAAWRAGTATLVAWFAQTFLQLVLLSIIMVGQRVAAAKSDMQLEQTYMDAEALLQINDDMHKLVKQNVHLTEQINELLAQNTELTQQINELIRQTKYSQLSMIPHDSSMSRNVSGRLTVGPTDRSPELPPVFLLVQAIRSFAVIVHQHLLRARRQLFQIQLVVRRHHDLQRIANRRSSVIVLQRVLGAVDRAHVGPALQVVAGHVNFIVRQAVGGLRFSRADDELPGGGHADGRAHRERKPG